MRTLLHIDSSPVGQASVSRRLTKEFVARWRDLAAMNIPPITGAWIAANAIPTASRTPDQSGVLALSTAFCGDLREADEYVIGTPMLNRGPSGSLKLWVDQIVRFWETLDVTPSGLVGTLEGKQATFIIAAGGTYAFGSEGASRNYVEPWLRSLFGYLGVTNQRFVIVDRARAVIEGKVPLADFLPPDLDAVHALFGCVRYSENGNLQPSPVCGSERVKLEIR
jgi:FMN-dependent NADH-azoreductase